MSEDHKHIVWLHGEVKTPPFGGQARLKAGFFLRMLQEGLYLEMPDSRPMPSIGKNCHELRINDSNKTWRIMYYIDTDAIVILEVFAKKAQQTPKEVIDNCKKRLARYINTIGN
jgi:phage-related protein